ELPRDPRDLRVRDGAYVPHDTAEHRHARHLDLPVLRRLWCCDRVAHHGHRRHQLRRLHSARPDHALAPHAEHLQRVVRHLLSQVYGHHLRAPLRPRLLRGDRHQLRRGGGYQVHDPGPHHPRNVGAVRAARGPAPALDARVPRANVRDLQPLRLPPRHMGRGFREAPTRAVPHHHAPDLPRRLLLLGERPAALLADGNPLQPRRVPDQRLPLELLRRRRRERRPEPRHDGLLPGRLPDGGVVDLQDGVPPEDV
ncbi:MAG: Efflux ABC transporter, permease protein, partial [uncultured Rubrobacteraceae bacterium]